MYHINFILLEFSRINIFERGIHFRPSGILTYFNLLVCLHALNYQYEITSNLYTLIHRYIYMQLLTGNKSHQ